MELDKKKTGKEAFLAKIAEKSGHTKTEVKVILKNFQTVLLDQLQEHGKVTILELGQFKISERAERVGINPRTKEKQIHPAKKVVKLAASSKLKSFATGETGSSDFSY